MVDLLERWMPGFLAVILTLLTLVVFLGGAWLGTVATVTDNVETLTERAPAAAAEIERDNEAARDFELEGRVTAFVDDLDERLGREAQVRGSASTLSSYVVSGILVLFLIVYGPKFVTGALGQIDDPGRRRRVAAIGSDAIGMWRRYVLAAVAQMAVVTLVAWVVLWAVDLPGPFVLALIIGGFSVVPYMGILVGGIPALLFVFATAEPGRIVAVLLLLVVLQLVAAGLVLPRVQRVSLYVGPALPLIGALLGWSLYGLGGAVYTVALVVLALAVIDAVARHPAADPEARDGASPTMVGAPPEVDD